MKKIKKLVLITIMLLGCIAQASAGIVNLGGWESTNHDDGSTSSHTVTFTGTQLQFNWFVDSEQNYDKLIVKLDGAIILDVSGTIQSGTYTDKNLSSQGHTLEFSYEKDGSTSSGSDQARITDITVLVLETISFEGLEYVSHEDNTLTVTGYSALDKVLTIPSTITVKGTTYSVTAIAADVFKNCNSFDSITIPQTITQIGNNAFYGCSGELIVNCNIPDLNIPDLYEGNGVFANSNFTKLTIGESVSSIGCNAFINSLSLQEVILSDSLMHIGSSAFRGCVSLQTVDFSKATELDSIAGSAFDECKKLKSVDLSATKVRVIGSNAFSGTSQLSAIAFPATLERIYNSVFYNCDNLQSIDLSDTKVVELGSTVFYDCNNLQSVSLPNTLKKINSNVFNSCGNLRKINLSKVEEIGYQAFYGCYGLDTLDLSSAKNIGSQAFNYSRIFIINSATPAAITANSFTDESKFIVTPDAYDTFCTTHIWNKWANNISMYSVDANGVKWIYRYLKDTNSMSITAASGYGKNVVVPSSMSYNGADVPVTHLENVFHGTNITSVVLPENLTAINSSAFYNCSSLTTIEIPNSVTEIGSSAFYNCDSLTAIEIPNSVTEIGSSAFAECSSLTNVTLPTGLTKLSSNTFHSCAKILTIDIPKGVKRIDEAALAGTSIRVLTVPESVDTIVQGAFPSSMRKLVCERPTPPEIVENYAGESPDLGNIFIVYVPKGCRVKYLTKSPWSSNRVIVDGSGVAVNVNVTPGMMGEEILNHTEYLSDVNFLILSGSVNQTDINNLKNSMPNLLTVDMKGLDMKAIPSSLFANRRAILNVTLPDNVETIGGAAFANCINLDSIVLPEGLIRLGDAVYNNNTYDYSDGGCFSNCDMLSSVTFPSTLEYIGSYAFYDCSYLKTLNLGNGLKNIGEYAFSNCYNIQEVEFNNKIENIESYAFSYCRSLTSLQFPEGLKTISAGAFADCYNLNKIEFGEGLISIGYSYESSSDDDYYYTDYRGAFSNCTSLQNVTLPNSLQNIYQYTFNGCTKLSYIKIPEGVKYIGKYAFRNCNNLVKVDLPSTLYNCSKSPFSGCTKLADVNCLALIPPTLADGLLTLNDMGMPLQRVLNVPEWTVNRYKLSSGWAAFSKILPIPSAYPASINIYNEAVLILPDSLPANYKPNMNIVSQFEYANGNYMTQYASLHLRGKGTLSLNTFNFSNASEMDAMMYSQLLNDANITADTVRVSIPLYDISYDGNSSRWYFLSFPFDVQISDVVTSSDWVVRQYDGKARANSKYNATWVTVSATSMLNAGKGYIWSSSGGNFTITAMDNANKNNIFANDERKVALQKYESDIVANSSWNLIGNPFPCYYDSRYMDFTAPITVWDMYNNTYSAYSPVDDNYVFKPFEAFFVQRPEKVDSITFRPTGRQLSSVASSPANARAYSDKAKRMVFNLLLSNDKYTDRTRIVLNDIAKMEYEMNCDASKFMNTDANTPQLYTLYNNEKYAINERPINNGIVGLGMYVANAGTYTISLKDVCEQTVILVDLNTGIETDLSKEDYTFDAEVGENNNFEVRIYTDMEATAIEDVDASKLSNITANNGVIAINNHKDVKVTIYNVAGQLVASNYGKSMRFDVEPGLYIVEINGKSQKVHVVK